MRSILSVISSPRLAKFRDGATKSTNCRPTAIQHQQLAEDLAVGDVRRPTVRGSHSRVKGVVGIGEPLRAGVVEVRQRALFERLRRVLVAGKWPLRGSRGPVRPPTRPTRAG